MPYLKAVRNTSTRKLQSFPPTRKIVRKPKGKKQIKPFTTRLREMLSFGGVRKIKK